MSELGPYVPPLKDYIIGYLTPSFPIKNQAEDLIKGYLGRVLSDTCKPTQPSANSAPEAMDCSGVQKSFLEACKATRRVSGFGVLGL